MTSDQQNQFNLFGCISRSIIKYAEMVQKPITADDFCARFEKHFPQNQYGLLSLDKFCLIVIELGLGQSVDSTRNASFAIDEIQNRNPVFVHTCFELDHALNVKGILNHCRLLVGFQGSAIYANPVLAVWCPHQDGTDGVIHVSLERLDKEFAHYWILS